jgi:hypothetical protein
MSEQFIIDLFRSACYGSVRRHRGGILQDMASMWTSAQFRAVRVFLVAASGFPF